jgi:hypothetical protein
VYKDDTRVCKDGLEERKYSGAGVIVGVGSETQGNRKDFIKHPRSFCSGAFFARFLGMKLRFCEALTRENTRTNLQLNNLEPKNIQEFSQCLSIRLLSLVRVLPSFHLF